MNIWPKSYTQLNASTPGVQFLIRSGFIKRFKCSFSYTAHLLWLSQYSCVVAVIIGVLDGFTIYEEQIQVTNKNLPNLVLVITLCFIVKHLISVIGLLFCHISVKVSPYFSFKMHSDISIPLQKVLYLLIKQQLISVTWNMHRAQTVIQMNISVALLWVPFNEWLNQRLFFWLGAMVCRLFSCLATV